MPNLKQEELRAVTYNVHGWRGADKKTDWRRALQLINSCNPSLVGLQEVVIDNPSAEAPTAEQLQNESNMHFIPGIISRHNREGFGNGLLTSARVTHVARHDLSHRQREPRGALDVRLTIGSIAARVIVTHFGLSFRERPAQGRKLSAILRQDPQPDTIVMGDFNVWFGTRRFFTELAQDYAPLLSPPTYPARFPLLPLDRIWVKPAWRLKKISALKSAPARLASDHLPLLAQLDFR